jgi:predicted MPP superfamily phosphohydrolase
MFFKSEATLREFVERVAAGDKLPRILSPNLGCPLFLPFKAPESKVEFGPIVIACGPEDTDWENYRLAAVPSFSKDNKAEGVGFSLKLKYVPTPLDDVLLPAEINDLGDTRHLISNFIRKSVYPEARFYRVHAFTESPVGEQNCRHANGRALPTLFDLSLEVRGTFRCRMKHALCLRPDSSGIRFVHLTDLHVAERNDIWKKEWGLTVGTEPEALNQQFINFNEHLRKFINWANKEANEGKLDLVLVLGDLVDFVAQGLGDSPTDESNWRFVAEMFTGSAEECGRGNPGLRVPIFTSTGNHDWRFSPYPPDATAIINYQANIFGIDRCEAKKLDYLYHDSSETIGKRIAEVNSKLIQKGSPVLARSWWGSIVGGVLQWFEVTVQSATTRFFAIAGKIAKMQSTPAAVFTLILALLGIRFTFLRGKPIMAQHVVIYLAIFEGLVFATLPFIRNWFGEKLRQVITGVMAIEAGTEALTEYFLLFNPYFNYAFQLGKCKFLILDTGPDCLTGQSFWDEGGKNVQRVKIKGNILGGSPDSMGFYAPNVNYSFSQISWLELVLDCIRRHPGDSTESEHIQLAGKRRSCRVFAGIHAPAGNLSCRSRKKAQKLFESAGEKPVLLPSKRIGGFNVHYGCINHFLSQFYYLALGSTEKSREEITGPGIDFVLSGHTHWNMEFELQPPAPKADGQVGSPAIFYGAFSPNIREMQETPHKKWSPLLLQTAACGPPSATQQDNPNFRCIAVDGDLRVTELQPLKWSKETNGPVPAPIL